MSSGCNGGSVFWIRLGWSIFFLLSFHLDSRLLLTVSTNFQKLIGNFAALKSNIDNHINGNAAVGGTTGFWLIPHTFDIPHFEHYLYLNQDREIIILCSIFFSCK